MRSWDPSGASRSTTRAPHWPVEDDVLAKTRCAICGAGIDDPEERPILEVAEVEALASAIEPHLRPIVLAAAAVTSTSWTAR